MGKRRRRLCRGHHHKSNALTKANLAGHDVLVLNNCMNFDVSVFDSTQREEFPESADTKAIVGIHASIMHTGHWKGYGDLTTTRFAHWRATSSATVAIERAENGNPRDITGVHVLTTLAEPPCSACGPTGDHPLSFCRTLPEGGRYLYTGLGYSTSVFDSDTNFRIQISNAIL